jgi:predicted HTH transcriptional regulator
MVLSDILKDFRGEDSHYEVKVRLNRKDPLSWLKTIDGFANGKGGTLIIGAADKTYELQGFDLKAADDEKLYFSSRIREAFQINPVFDIHLLPYSDGNATRYVIQADIAESEAKPVVLMHRGMGFIYVRRDASTEPATSEEIRQMAIRSSAPSYDIQPTDAAYKPGDFNDLAGFYSRQTGKTLREKDLASVGFFDDKKKLAKGALYFKDGCALDETSIVCSIYPASTRGGDEALTTAPFKGNLVKGLDFILNFVGQHSLNEYKKLSDRRVEKRAYPQRALFEAVVNALAHRDYTIRGSQISVDLFPNRLVITSPGSFPGGDEIAPTKNLSAFNSRRRNALICAVFVLCRAMESRGTGFEKIENEYSGYDDLHRPFIFSRNSQFSIVLPDVTNDEGVSVLSESLMLKRPIENGSRHDLGILSFCYGKEKQSREIASNLGLSDSSFFRSSILANLAKQGFLNMNKRGKATVYQTNEGLVSLR